MIKELGPGFRLTLIFTVLTGLLYPAVMTGVSELIFPKQANGSLVTCQWKSCRIEPDRPAFRQAGIFSSAAVSGGQWLRRDRQSAARTWAPRAPNSSTERPKWMTRKTRSLISTALSYRIVHYCVDNDIPYESSVPLDQFKDSHGDLDDVKLIKAFNDDKTPLLFTPKAPIPPDAVTASASGLDPHISPANAEIQAARVAKARGVSADQVKQLIAQFTDRADLGISRRAARQCAPVEHRT